ncbi:MAG TPA: hypothetical protein VLE53_14610 [Gemmatimonadaceae bacterium]|nr:hypothetical protein [Gemmatimonadaceae bacterium]
MSRRLVLTAILSCLSPTMLEAQCRVGPETNEAKLLAYYAAPLAFSPGGTLEPMTKGALRVTLDLTWIPAPDDDLRRTEQCFLPKEENTQLSPVLPRPRVALGLPNDLLLEATWLPPITVADATPNLVSLAVAFVRHDVGPFGVAARLHATVGSVEGPITCPTDALQLSDPSLACFGSSESSDSYRPNIAGLEAALTWRRGERLAGYAGAGFSILRPRFQVGFQPSGGAYDSTRVVVDLDRLTAMAGVRYGISRGAFVTGELYAVPEDVVLVRLGAGVRLR